MVMNKSFQVLTNVGDVLLAIGKYAPRDNGI